MNYGDGSAAETWTYVAAGNRSSASATPGAWTYDNLNRMVASPGATYSNDVLGNRTGKVSGGVTTSYSWDTVNRMDVYATTAGSSGYKNQYRADGMRVKKETGWTVSGSPGAYVVNDLGSGLQTRTYYDGQMPVEEGEGPRGESVAKWTLGCTRPAHAGMCRVLVKEKRAAAYASRISNLPSRFCPRLAV